jgi:hypothetical protein|nr:MAG: hypothetical protein [uncultured cyanophage]WFD61412.1 MAG: hypothetical protein [uncultured cyanophage]
MKKEEQNIHAAASAGYCEKMAKRNGWKLVDVRPNGDPILPKDCVFEGKQTSFQEEE